jgi:hypothetical protein
MRRSKKPVVDRVDPRYPEYEIAQKSRREFIALLGGAGAASLLMGCGSSKEPLAGKVVSPHGQINGTNVPDNGDSALQIAEEPGDVPSDSRPDLSPPGMPPRPEHLEVLRLPPDAVYVASFSGGGTISFAVWIEHDNPKLKPFVHKNLGTIERAFTDVISNGFHASDFDHPQGEARAKRSLQETFEKLYTSESGEPAGIGYLRIEIKRKDDKMPVPGGISAPIEPQTRPRPRGVPPLRPPENKLKPILQK